MERGLGQVGSLGSGNHFLEVQAVDAVYDPLAADAMGLRLGQTCVVIHCGSCGLGHQICTDHVRTMERAMASYGIAVPDRQLACTPVRSPEGRRYLAAMAAARQLRKIEDHDVDGRMRRVCVHRKGATRALPPGHPDLPDDLRAVGQPVLIPGTMGTCSYVLVGTAPGDAFSSTAHGAGRVQSRHQAARQISGRQLRQQLERRVRSCAARPGGAWPRRCRRPTRT